MGAELLLATCIESFLGCDPTKDCECVCVCGPAFMLFCLCPFLGGVARVRQCLVSMFSV